ncbi:MAG: divergent PAP2 family protein [Longimicrobiaceae bacterium]
MDLAGWVRGVIEWNPVLVLPLLAATTAQGIKFLAGLATHRRVDFTRLIGTGGLPSSHSASVTALSTAAGLEAGWSSALFGVCAFFSLVVMYDATGIRRAAGRQARVLNHILEELKDYHKLGGERLIELLGHTPVEVVAGAAYGVALALVLYA